MRGQFKGTAALTCATSAFDVCCSTVQHILIWTVFCLFKNTSPGLFPNYSSQHNYTPLKRRLGLLMGTKHALNSFSYRKIVTCRHFLLYVSPTVVQWSVCLVPQALQSSFGTFLCYWSFSPNIPKSGTNSIESFLFMVGTHHLSHSQTTQT